MGVGRVVEVDSGLEDGVGCYAEVAAERWHYCCGLRKDGGSWGRWEDSNRGTYILLELDELWEAV